MRSEGTGWENTAGKGYAGRHLPAAGVISSFLCICILMLSINGCAQRTVAVPPEQGGSGDVRIIAGISFHPQEDYQCGPASLASVLNYWGVVLTPGDIAKEIYSVSARGTLGIDLMLYAREKGLEASSYSGGIDDIRLRIDSGHPLIVLVDYGFSVFQANHFMVVVGYTEEGVIVNSGREERKVIPAGEFMRSWERTKYWTLLIKRP